MHKKYCKIEEKAVSLHPKTYFESLQERHGVLNRQDSSAEIKPIEPGQVMLPRNGLSPIILLSYCFIKNIFHLMKKVLFFSAMGIICTAVANATVADGQDSLRLEQLEEVSVSATRAGEKTPMAHTDLSRRDIEQHNIGADIPFLLSLTPSVTITSDAGNGIGYTTLRIRGTAPERINVTANGIPLNDAESAQVFWVNMGDFASSLQNIQIQRGVGTSTNGAGAFGASVNMQTENIGTEPFVGLDASAGSYKSHKETLRFGTGLMNGHWGLQGRLSNIGSDGYIDRASTSLYSYFLQAGYFGERTVVKFITYNGVEKTYHAWDYTSKYEQKTYGRTFNPCGAMDWDYSKYYDNQTDNYRQQNYQLLWNQQLSDHLYLNAGLHYTKGKGYYEQYKIEAKWADYGLWSATDGDIQSKGGSDYKPIVKGDLVRQKRMDNDFYGAIASLRYNNEDNLEAIIGGGWNRYDGDHFGRIIWQTSMPYKYYYNKANDAKWKDADGNKYFYTFSDDRVTEPDFEYYRNNAEKTDFNIYGKVNYTLFDGLSGYLDLQYRQISYRMQHPGDWFGANTDDKYIIDDTFRFFNPKFGLNYQINDNQRVYASYAIAHKEPTRNDYEANIGLKMKAEQLNDLEAGYQFLSKTFSAGANIYWMDYKDQFVLTGELNDIGEAVAINVPDSYRMGIELEAAWQPAKWFRWDANATLSRNRVKDVKVAFEDGSEASLGDQPLSFSPDFIANTVLTFQQMGFKASLMGQYIGEQYLTNSGFKKMTCWENYWEDPQSTTRESIVLDGHFTTNLDLTYQFELPAYGIRNINVGITLYNLLSTKYDTGGWAAPSYRLNNGKVEAYNASCISDGAVRDQWGVGFAPAATFHCMAHLSLLF